MSWNDAVEFCKWLSVKEGEIYRLPTEAEWEYACRAGSSTVYSFDGGTASLGDFAWYKGNSVGTTHPVGQKRPNELGLFDMHGNVWEWCSDGFAADYYKRTPSDDPPGTDPAARRTIRGGSWYNDPRHLRSAYRRGNVPNDRYGTTGFRVTRVQSGG